MMLRLHTQTIIKQEGVSEMAMANCEVCGGTGEADSGAPKPDGGWYTVPCECTMSPSPPPDVVEAAMQTTKRFGELDGEAWKDVQAVCEWVLSHKAIDK